MYALTWLIKLDRWLYLIYKHETLEYVRQIKFAKIGLSTYYFPFVLKSLALALSSNLPLQPYG